MDWNFVLQAVGSYGFPIILAFWLLVKMDRQDERHKNEIDAMRQSLDNNTIALNKLIDRLDERK